jgi:hypothetical protein
MWLSMVLFTLFVASATTLQLIYWLKREKKREAWVCFGWMMFLWVIGMSFVGGFELPAPTKPIFPAWK